MAIKSLQDWKDTLEALPKVADASWSNTFANWYADMIADIEPDPSAFTAVGFLFTFQPTIFANGLSSLPPTTDPASGIIGFATAWEAALLASIALVGPGSVYGPSSPATTFSAVATTIIDIPSIALGKAKLLELIGAAPVDDAQNSQFPVKFREATLLLTFTAVGTDSTPTPAGPLPLTAALVPFK